jgi:hypothetical protein
MPPYNEIARLPFFIWDPRYGCAGERREALAQNIDVAATLLEYFGQPLPEDMQGRPFGNVIAGGERIRDYALFGYFGGSVNITDGRYIYMRGPASQENAPLYEYTLMPARMGERIALKDLQSAELHPGFAFTKGCPVLKIDMAAHHNNAFFNPYKYGSRLYDLQADPKQNEIAVNPEAEARLITQIKKIMTETEAPAEQYVRLGL